MNTMIQRADMLTAVLGADLMMMSLETGRYHNLVGVGPHIWELLAEPTTTEAIISKLLATYEVPPEVCASEVTTFLADLRERGLVVSSTEST